MGERVFTPASHVDVSMPHHVWLRLEAPHRQPSPFSRTLAQLISRNASSLAGCREASFCLETDEVIKTPGLSWSLAHRQLFVVLFFSLLRKI